LLWAPVAMQRRSKGDPMPTYRSRWLPNRQIFCLSLLERAAIRGKLSGSAWNQPWGDLPARKKAF